MLKPLQGNNKNLSLFVLCCLGIICLGIGARVLLYLRNDSFWLDETYVAYQVTQQTFGEIFSGFSVLKGQPVSPALFSAAAKIFALIFGNHEMALRLVPFVFGLSALILFYFLARLYFSDKTFFLLACALFAVSPPLIRYCAEFKMYASDVWSAVLMLYLFERLDRRGWDGRAILIIGEVCAVIMWLSYPAVFFLPGFFIVLFWKIKERLNAGTIKAVVFTGGIWITNGLLLYLLFIRRVSSGDSLSMEIWSQTPALFHDGGRLGVMAWGAGRLWDMMRFFFSPQGAWIAAVLCGTGIIVMTRTRWQRAVVLGSPLLWVFMFSFFGRYPFYERFILFLCPSVLVFCTQGFLFFYETLPQKYRYVFIGFVSVCLSVLSFNGAVKGFSMDSGRAQNREVFQYFQRALQPGDLVILNNQAQFPLVYYLASLDMDTTMFPSYARAGGCRVADASVFGVIPEENIDTGKGAAIMTEVFFADDQRRRFLPREKSVDRFDLGPDLPFCFTDKQRVWVLFSHLSNDKRAFCLESLKAHGRILDRFEANGASLYLFDFSRKG